MADNLTITIQEGTVDVSTRDRGGVHIQGVAGALATATTTGFNATSTSSTALAANTARLGLLIQNFSDEHIFGAFSATPVATAGSEVGFLIPAMGMVSFYAMTDTRAVNVIHAGTGSKRLLITEYV